LQEGGALKAAKKALKAAKRAFRMKRVRLPSKIINKTTAV
jgi:hypothetical protein